MGEVTHVDFKAVKEAVTLVQVLDFYGVSLRKVNATTYRGKCPLPTHPAASDKESLSVLVDKRMWVCHSTMCNQNAKRKSGDVIDFVKIKEGIDSRQAGLWLHARFMNGTPQEVSQSDLPVVSTAVSQPEVTLAATPSDASGKIAAFIAWLGEQALMVSGNTTLAPNVRLEKMEVYTLVKLKAHELL